MRHPVEIPRPTVPPGTVIGSPYRRLKVRLRNSSGTYAIFAAIRRASSRVSKSCRSASRLIFVVHMREHGAI